MFKKGVTLLTLSITLVVLAILTTAVIVNTSTITKKSELAKFGEELKLIEDSIEEYYILNGKLPVRFGGDEYSVANLKSLHESGFEDLLGEEIVKNKDENSTFYLIDYDAIKVKLNDKGLEQEKDDVYLLASGSNRVYYVRGIEIGTEVYFSLANITTATVVE